MSGVNIRLRRTDAQGGSRGGEIFLLFKKAALHAVAKSAAAFPLLLPAQGEWRKRQQRYSAKGSAASAS